MRKQPRQRVPSYPTPLRQSCLRVSPLLRSIVHGMFWREGPTQHAATCTHARRKRAAQCATTTNSATHIEPNRGSRHVGEHANRVPVGCAHNARPSHGDRLSGCCKDAGGCRDGGGSGGHGGCSGKGQGCCQRCEKHDPSCLLHPSQACGCGAQAAAQRKGTRNDIYYAWRGQRA